MKCSIHFVVFNINFQKMLIFFVFPLIDLLLLKEVRKGFIFMPLYDRLRRICKQKHAARM
jgi:hypothetical protein